MEEKDFKIIKPLRRFSEYYNTNYYIVPCEIIRFLDERTHNGQFVTLKITDPNNGKLGAVKGLIYDRTIEMIKEMGEFNLPIKTQCCIYKDCNIIPGERISFIVYGFFNAGLLENIFGINEIGFLSDKEKNIVFENNYVEFNNWLKN